MDTKLLQKKYLPLTEAAYYVIVKRSMNLVKKVKLCKNLN